MVYLMLAEGFEEIEALTVVDVLRRGEVDVLTVAADNNDYICGAHSITVKADIKFTEINYDECEFIVLPGGMPGTLNLQNNKELESLLNRAYSDNKFLCAICAAPMILGNLKFLENKEATCYPSFEQYLINASLSEKRVCQSENIITSRGAGTAHDFAFSILKEIKGTEVSNKIKESMLYDC